LMQPPDPTPLLQPHYRAFLARTSRSAPVLRIGTLASRFWPLGLLPSHQSDWFLQFHAMACIRFTPPLRRSPSAQSSGTLRTCPRWDTRSWFRRHLFLNDASSKGSLSFVSRMLTCTSLFSHFSFNAHHHGSLPQQLG